MTTSPPLLDQASESTPWQGKTVGIIPFPALGDTTIYLRLAQSLANAGSSVVVYSDALAPAADLFNWLTVRRLTPIDLRLISTHNDLVIADIQSKDILAFNGQTGKLAGLPNFVAVTAKTFPALPSKLNCPEWVAGRPGVSPHQPFCPGKKFGMTMVEWVDHYVEETLGLAKLANPPSITTPIDWTPDQQSAKRIVIFPTTPNPSKNYSLSGFKRLYNMLERNGWKTDIVCMQNELDELSSAFPRKDVITFESLRSLILHLLQSKAVISNDSGGGHLASLLGLPTFTITKKKEDFVWRPGFSDKGHVISPMFTFKWITGRVWRPFIPLHRIVKTLSQLPDNRR